MSSCSGKTITKCTCIFIGEAGEGEKRTRKSRGPNKCRRTWFYSISRFLPPLSVYKKKFMYTNRWTFHVLLFPQCTVQQLTFCLMHRHRKLITTKETMVCNCSPKEKSWDSQPLLIPRTAPTRVQTGNHKLGQTVWMCCQIEKRKKKGLALLVWRD